MYLRTSTVRRRSSLRRDYCDRIHLFAPTRAQDSEFRIHDPILQPNHSHLSTFTDPHILNRPLARPTATSARRPNVLNHPDNLHALRDLPEDDMLPVEKRRRRTRDEKLTSIGVRSGIRHRQQPSRGMLVHERLVRKRRVIVDRRRARPVRVQEVAALRHEILDL